MAKIKFSALLAQDYPISYKKISDILNKHHITHELIPNTNDIWARDYMPLSCDGFDVSYIYEPDYLQDKKYSNLKTKIKPCSKHLPFIIDGGNFVRYGKKAVMTDKVFAENNTFTKDEIIRTINATCGLDELVIIPRQPYDIFGHSDSMVRWIDDSTVLINDFSLESKTWNQKLINALKKYNLNIVSMQYSDGFLSKERDWGAYLNFLIVDNVMLLPIYGIDEDAKVVEFLKTIYKNILIEPIEINEIINQGGAMHCISSGV